MTSRHISYKAAIRYPGPSIQTKRTFRAFGGSPGGRSQPQAGGARSGDPSPPAQAQAAPMAGTSWRPGRAGTGGGPGRRSQDGGPGGHGRRPRRRAQGDGPAAGHPGGHGRGPSERVQDGGPDGHSTAAQAGTGRRAPWAGGRIGPTPAGGLPRGPRLVKDGTCSPFCRFLRISNVSGRKGHIPPEAGIAGSGPGRLRRLGAQEPAEMRHRERDQAPLGAVDEPLLDQPVPGR